MDDQPQRPNYRDCCGLLVSACASCCCDRGRRLLLLQLLQAGPLHTAARAPIIDGARLPVSTDCMGLASSMMNGSPPRALRDAEKAFCMPVYMGRGPEGGRRRW